MTDKGKAASYVALGVFFLSTLAPDLMRQFPGVKWIVVAAAVLAAAGRALDYWRGQGGTPPYGQAPMPPMA